jgi:anti-sigma factor RsiW
MTVTRDVILDLLPAYLAGDAHPATRALVDEFLTGDADLAREVAEQRKGLLEPIAGAPPMDVELRSLGRTRRRLSLQRWLFALGWFFLATTFTTRISFAHGRFTEFRLVLQDSPWLAAMWLALSAGCWIAYWMVRRPK